MPDKHNRIGGSTIERTIECPAWIPLSATAPKQSGSNEFADTGTLLHNCMEEYFTEVDSSFELMLNEGREYNGISLTEEMVEEKLKPALTAVYDIFGKVGVVDAFVDDRLMVEPFVELIEDDAGGSIDMLALNAEMKTVIILDYKFGFVPVAPTAKQLKFYALCASVDPSTAHFFEDAEEVVYTIVQPTDDPDTPNYATHRESVDELDDFELDVYHAIDLVDAITEKPSMVEIHTKAGNHCKYCPAAPTCPKKTGAARAALRLNPADASLVNANLAMVDELEKWCKEVKKLAHEQMELGVQLIDWKLVAKRGTRKWTEEEVVQKKIRNNKKLTVDETHEPRKLLSPAKLEKVLTKKGFDKDYFKAYYASISTGSTLAPRDDKRPEILQTPSPEALEALRDSL